jgi:hypothetical protein
MLVSVYFRRFWLLIPIVIVIGVVGCSEGEAPSVNDPEQSSEEIVSSAVTLVPSPSERVIISEGWIGGLDLTVRDLFLNLGRASPEGGESVVIGRAISADVNYDSSIIAHDQSGATPAADDPKGTATPDVSDPSTGVPFTHTTVVVEQVVAGLGLKMGDSFSISQIGELKDGVAYEARADPLILVGRAYVFFVYETRPGTWISHPAGRFEVDGTGKRHAVDPIWEQSAIAGELVGLTVNQAITSIQAVATLATVPAQ